MATEHLTASVGTQVAAADLRALQFTCVKVDSAGKIAAAGTLGEKILGIVQNKPNTGEVAQVGILGVSKAVCGGTVAAGALLMTTTGGVVITAATTGSTIIGWALEAGAITEIITIVLNPATGVV